jgi:hypothetical protein
MNLSLVLFPVFVQVALTFVLLGRMAYARIAALRAAEVSFRDIALGQDAWPARPTQLGRAYQNQFELPVLFYVLVALSILTRKDDLLFVVMSWLFVLLRIAHAYVHTTSNDVPARGRLFGAGMVVLALMWLIFAVRILAAV